MCYIVLFLVETSAPGLSGHYWYMYVYIYIFKHIYPPSPNKNSPVRKQGFDKVNPSFCGVGLMTSHLPPPPPIGASASASGLGFNSTHIGAVSPWQCASDTGLGCDGRLVAWHGRQVMVDGGGGDIRWGEGLDHPSEQRKWFGKNG